MGAGMGPDAEKVLHQPSQQPSHLHADPHSSAECSLRAKAQGFSTAEHTSQTEASPGSSYPQSKGPDYSLVGAHLPQHQLYFEAGLKLGSENT